MVGIIELMAPRPAQLPGQLCPAAAHGVGHAKTGKKLAEIVTGQANRHPGHRLAPGSSSSLPFPGGHRWQR